MTGGTVIGREGSRRARTACAILLALVAGLATTAGASADFKLRDIGNFKSPVHVDDAPGANGLLFVVEQQGRIRVLKNEVKRRRPFLDIKDRVQSGGEEGLLSVAFDPDYADSRLFYVFYTNADGDVQIDQFKRSTNKPLRANVNSREEVITIPHEQGATHNGGQLQFGPDGFLYAAIGDGGTQQDPEDDAQDPDTLLGKLIRIAPLPEGGYAIPATNPYEGATPGKDEIYALGLRNPWRFSFDSMTGALTIGDVGGQRFEEANYVPGPNAGLGANFGWNDFEGLEETAFGIDANASPHTPPIADFAHEDGYRAIAGGYVVRDPGLPSLQGQYVFGDLNRNKIQAIEVPSGEPGTPTRLKGGSVVSFGEGANEQLYVVDIGGDVFRLEET